MKTLDLRLMQVYFDLIKAGKKKKEYRKLDGYYAGRLIGGLDMRNMDEEKKREVLENLRNPHDRDRYMKDHGYYYRVGKNPGAYTHVRFRRGGTNELLTMEIEDIEVNGGQFVITLGKPV